MLSPTPGGKKDTRLIPFKHKKFIQIWRIIQTARARVNVIRITSNIIVYPTGSANQS